MVLAPITGQQAKSLAAQQARAEAKKSEHQETKKEANKKTENNWSGESEFIIVKKQDMNWVI